MNDERRLTHAIAGTREMPGFTGRCVYCGSRCNGRACAAHRDLVAVETSLVREPTAARRGA